jgi:hypothetical protein
MASSASSNFACVFFTSACAPVGSQRATTPRALSRSTPPAPPLPLPRSSFFLFRFAGTPAEASSSLRASRLSLPLSLAPSIARGGPPRRPARPSRPPGARRSPPASTAARRALRDGRAGGGQRVAAKPPKRSSYQSLKMSPKKPPRKSRRLRESRCERVAETVAAKKQLQVERGAEQAGSAGGAKRSRQSTAGGEKGNEWGVLGGEEGRLEDGFDILALLVRRQLGLPQRPAAARRARADPGRRVPRNEERNRKRRGLLETEGVAENGGGSWEGGGGRDSLSEGLKGGGLVAQGGVLHELVDSPAELLG